MAKSRLPSAGIKITTPPAKMASSINLIFREIIRNAMTKAQPRVEEKIRNLLKMALGENETMQSILGGKLRSHFGIENPKETETHVFAQLLSEISVSFSIKRNLVTLKFGVIWKSFAGLLGLNVSTTKSDGGDVPWMKHLLFDGNKVLIRGYNILIKEGLPGSRSGNALMIEVDNKRERGLWRVPIEYSGVKELNFLTKLLDALADRMLEVAWSELERVFYEPN